MKQVWILNHYALEPGGAGGTRHFNLAANLPANGWQATVIAASVELNSGRQRLIRGEMRRLEKYAGIPFLWIRTPEYEGNNGGRMINMLSYTVRVLLPSYTKGLPKPDVVVGSSVHPFAAWAGAILARRHRVPFVFEVRDLWPQTLIDLGRLKERSLTSFMLRYLEKWLYRQAIRIVVLLPRAVDYIVPLGISEKKVVWIPNGVDLSSFATNTSLSSVAGSPFVLMYFGAHGQANGLDNILQAMKLVHEQVAPGTIKLRMIGDGPLKSDLVRLMENMGLNNVSFESTVPKKDIPKVASEADAFVIAVLNKPLLYRYGISMNKLFDYLAAERPIVIASNAINNPVADAGAGLTVPPGDPKSLAKAVIELSRMSIEERRQLGVSGRKYVEENHGFDRLAERLATTLNISLDEYQCQD